MTQQKGTPGEGQPNADSNIQAKDSYDAAKINFPIIGVGASAGGMEAMKKLVAGLPQNLGAAILIVWHMSPEVRGILPDILNKDETLFVANAYDGEPIVKNRIYVAPPDHHLVVEEGNLRITKGPKENRFRPAVDPLFRSAAHTYGNQVIGIILSGALDDGTAGLWAIKHRGGIAIVQDLLDAEVPSMPENAMRKVAVDYCVPAAEMPALLQELVKQLTTQTTYAAAMENEEKEKIEIRIAEDENALQAGVLRLGEPTMLTCPECHGVLQIIKEGSLRRYRCHTGHAFSPDSLLAALTQSIEESLWNAVRSIEESTMLLNHIGDHYAEINQPKLAAMYFKKANEAGRRAGYVREAVLQHEALSQEGLEEKTEKENGKK